MRILIVEDELLTAFDLQCLVEEAGHEGVDLCGTLACARQNLTQSVDFVFLDVDLPDGKSFDQASDLQRRGMPFTFVSASRRSDLPAHLRQSRFIAKPYSPSAIRTCLTGEHSLAC